MSNIGQVYLLTNPALAGIVKIGHTTRVDAQLRADELSASTSIPLAFVVESTWIVEHPAACEAAIHRKLAFCRVAKNREFFRIDPDEAKANIDFLVYGTDEPSELLVRQVKSLVSLYRKYPDSFSNSDNLITELEQIVGCESGEAL